MKSVYGASGKSSLLPAFCKIDNFVYLTLKESLLEINHSLIFCSFLFIFEKRTLISLCSKNGFVSTANIVVLAIWGNLGDHLRILNLTVVQG